MIGNLYYSQTNNTMVRNMHFLNIIQNNTNKNLQNYFNKEKNDYIEKDVFFNIRYDVKTLTAQQNSLIKRPLDLKRPSEKSAKIEFSDVLNHQNNWVRIGYYEEENQIKPFSKESNENYRVFQGLIFNDGNIEFPFNEKVMNPQSLWEDSIMRISNLKGTIITANVGFSRCQFEDYRILWIIPELILILNLKVRESIYGLKAFNELDENILVLGRWDTKYVGYNSFSDEIPQLSGCELLIRKDYFKKITDLYGTKPQLLTCKI